MNVIDYLKYWTDKDPDRRLFTFTGRDCEQLASYTYSEFHKQTNRLAGALVEQVGIGVGEPVLLAYPPGLEMITSFISCVKTGAIPVPVPPPTNGPFADADSRIALISASVGATRVLTDASVAARTAADRVESGVVPPRSLKWVATNDLDLRTADFAERSQKLLFLQYTSGSTQQARGVMVSHDNVISNCLGTLDHIPLGVSWLPHFHDMGLIGFYLFPLISGGSAVNFSPAEFLRRPGLWLKAISRFGGTITSAPNFAYEYCLRPDKIPDEMIPELNLSTLRTVLNGAEEVQPRTMMRFRERFAKAGLRPDVVVGAYGLAENTLCATVGGTADICVSRRLLERRQLKIVLERVQGHNTTTVASCGKPVHGVEIRIVSADDGREVPAGQIGEIWISGSSKALGYWHRDDLTDGTFRARLEGRDTDFLRTGDIGFLYGDELYVCGRIKDIIIVRGVNIYPSDIEYLVEVAVARQPTRVVVFGSNSATENSEALVILIECRRSATLPDLPSLYRRVQAQAHAPIRIIACVPKGSLARTSSGKISRQQCRDRWTAGNIQSLARFEAPAGRGSVDFVAYCNHLLNLADGRADLTLGEIGLDSFDLVTLSLEVERYLRERFPKKNVPEEIFDLRIAQSLTIGQIQELANKAEGGRVAGLAFSTFYRRAAQSATSHDLSMMRQDSSLPSYVQATAEPAGLQGSDGDVLLTGGTGFLGAHLTAALLRLTTRKLLVLVRGPDLTTARRRIVGALARAHVAADFDPAELDARVEVLQGDITAPQFGLTDHDWSRAGDRVSTVFHCGAEVDYVKSYSALRAPNVLGTHQVLKFCSTGIPKMLHHISTTFIFGWSTAARVFEHDFNVEMESLDFGYSQSKWVSEQIIRNAANGGIRQRIYRPAFLTASRQGDYVRDDLLARLFSYMIRHGISVDSRNELSMLPVDVAAHNIVAIALLDDPGGDVFHITSDRYSTMQMACERITEQYGYEFKYVSMRESIDHLNRFCGPNDVLFPLVAFIRSNNQKIDRMRDKRYDNRNYRTAREKSPHVLPEPSLAETVAATVEFLRQQHLIPINRQAPSLSF